MRLRFGRFGLAPRGFACFLLLARNLDPPFRSRFGERHRFRGDYRGDFLFYNLRLDQLRFLELGLNLLDGFRLDGLNLVRLGLRNVLRLDFLDALRLHRRRLLWLDFADLSRLLDGLDSFDGFIFGNDLRLHRFRHRHRQGREVDDKRLLRRLGRGFERCQIVKQIRERRMSSHDQHCGAGPPASFTGRG